MATPEAKAKVSAKLAAEVAQVQERLAHATRAMDEADAAYVAAAAAERKAWGPPAKEPTGKKLEAWEAALAALEDATHRRFRAVDAYTACTAQLAKLEDPATYDELVQRTAAAAERFQQLREQHASNGGGTRQPKAPKLNPPGSEPFVEAMAANRAEWEAYVAGQAAKDDAVKAAHRDGYQAYRKAYNGLLAARKAHQASVDAMVGNG